MNVLIVEDHEKNRILLRDLLGYLGYDTIEAKNGSEGVELAKQKIPDLILLDIQMPVMDGLTALKKLKECDETKNIKIIVLTSYAMSGDRERVLEAGANHYLSKPINTRELAKLIKEILHDKQS